MNNKPKHEYMRKAPVKILDDMRVSELAIRVFFKMWHATQWNDENEASDTCYIQISGYRGFANRWNMGVCTLNRAYKCLRDLGYILRINNRQSNVPRYRLYAEPWKDKKDGGNPHYNRDTGKVELPPRLLEKITYRPYAKYGTRERHHRHKRHRPYAKYGL